MKTRYMTHVPVIDTRHGLTPIPNEPKPAPVIATPEEALETMKYLCEGLADDAYYDLYSSEEYKALVAYLKSLIA